MTICCQRIETKSPLHFDKSDMMDLYGASTRLYLQMQKLKGLSVPLSVQKDIDSIVLKVNKVWLAGADDLHLLF